MASIIKRKKKICVVYRFLDAKGIERQKWETFDTMAEAKKRKHEIERKLDDNSFIPPKTTTVGELLDEYVSVYGVNTWAMSTYSARQRLIANYIKPMIGDVRIQDVTPIMADRYYLDLLKVKTVSSKYNHPRTEFVTPRTVKEIHKLMHSAFNLAVKWELITRNPFEKATLPKDGKRERNIWDADTLFKAIELCDDDNLKLAMNLSFSCSLRLGELLGLTWDCIDISEESIRGGIASVYVNKELQRVNKDVMEKLGEKGIIFRFPNLLGCKGTVLVLKEPKTQTSVRRVFLPESVAEMLIRHRKEQDEVKELMGGEYADYGLVFAGINGRPIEGSTLSRSFNALIRNNNLPKVVFHSLRHTSITYKLKLNGGDVKSVQGDSGHAQSSMVTDVYSHILDEGRQANAKLLESAFYKKDDGTAASEEAVCEAKQEDAATKLGQGKTENDMATLMRLLQNPEIADMLKTLSQAM